MSWDCQFRSSKPATCQLFTQPANYLLNLPTYFPTCKLFSQTCQLFPQPANFLPKPANFFPNLPTFSLNLPTFSQTCQLLSQDLGGDPPPQMAIYRNPASFVKLKPPPSPSLFTFFTSFFSFPKFHKRDFFCKID